MILAVFVWTLHDIVGCVFWGAVLGCIAVWGLAALVAAAWKSFVNFIAGLFGKGGRK